MLKSCDGKTDCLHLQSKLYRMKKYFLILLIAFGINAKAQITFEHMYSNPVGTVHFSGAGYKYYTFTNTATNSGILNIYNLNHSLYKSINTPASIPHSQFINFPITISNVSDSLFNTTTTDIEYMVFWNDTNRVYRTRIYDDIGNMLFSMDSLNCYPVFTTNGHKLICNPNGTLFNYQGVNSSIYSLPGALPCDECSNSVLMGITNPTANNNLSNPYPNPTNNSTRIDYTFPDGVNEGEIVVYNLQGVELKRFKVDRTFDHLLLSTADLPAGTYYFQLQTSKQNSAGKKMVVIK